jgi:hypothetical protein
MDENSGKKKKILIAVISGLVLAGVLIFAFLPDDLFSEERKIQKQREKLENNADYSSIAEEFTYESSEYEDVYTNTTSIDWQTQESSYTESELSESMSDSLSNMTPEEFADVLDYSKMDFSWYTDIKYDHVIDYSTWQQLSLPSDKDSWNYLTTFLSSASEDSTVIFKKLHFIKYLDTDKTCCICSFSDDDTVNDNLIILKNTYEPFNFSPDDRDTLNFSAYACNIKLQKVEDVTIAYALFSSDANRTSGGDSNE